MKCLTFQSMLKPIGLIGVLFGLLACGESTSTANSTEKDMSWAEVQANAFLGTLTAGISSISIGHQFFTLDDIEINESKRLVDYVYTVDRDAYVKHAYSIMHVNYHSYMIMNVDFELRKKLCKDVFATELGQRGYVLRMIRKMKDEDTSTVFTKDNCRLYLSSSPTLAMDDLAKKELIQPASWFDLTLEAVQCLAASVLSSGCNSEDYGHANRKPGDSINGFWYSPQFNGAITDEYWGCFADQVVLKITEDAVFRHMNGHETLARQILSQRRIDDKHIEIRMILKSFGKKTVAEVTYEDLGLELTPVEVKLNGKLADMRGSGVALQFKLISCDKPSATAKKRMASGEANPYRIGEHKPLEQALEEMSRKSRNFCAMALDTPDNRVICGWDPVTDKMRRP